MRTSALANAVLITAAALTLLGCEDTETDDDTDSATMSDSEWLLNTDDERSQYLFERGSTQGVLVNVESVDNVSIDDKNYVQVDTSGVPNYSVVVDQDLLDELNSRPKADTDFVTGQPGISVGDTVEFGQDIGYRSAPDCFVSGGVGYWPPGPGCPRDMGKTGNFPEQPQSNSSDCDTGLGPIGYYVNGASIFNWDDGMSYLNQDAWHNTAARAEVHDLDICSGHAAMGDYHHHTWSSCLAEQLGESRDGHSPIYGYAADGYPLHGPWHADGVLAVSAWRTRDYDDATSETGCGTAYERSCVLVDSYDISKGTTAAGSNGLDTNTYIVSQSGNPIAAVSGLYFEDYYYDSALTDLGGEYLDENNGHEHDELGYHYHMTVTDDGSGELTPAFPFSFGPRFHGTLDDNTVTRCGGLGP